MGIFMGISEDQVVRVLLREQVKVIAYIRFIVQDVHLAEDVFQDVCAEAVKRRDAIKSPAHLISWLRVTARHQSLNAIRANKKIPQLVDADLLDRFESRWQQYEDIPSSKIMQALQQCIAKLTPYARQIINLRYNDGLTGEDLASAVDRKMDTVYKSLSRTHKALGTCVRRRLSADKPHHE